MNSNILKTDFELETLALPRPPNPPQAASLRSPSAAWPWPRRRAPAIQPTGNDWRGWGWGWGLGIGDWGLGIGDWGGSGGGQKLILAPSKPARGVKNREGQQTNGDHECT